LLGGNVALALGPWFVRLADSGPVSAGFWRMTLALPLLLFLMLHQREQAHGYGCRDWLLVAGAGVIFALDLASWHIGIGQTRLGNAALFGNSGSILLMVGGLLALRRKPRATEVAAVCLAMLGAALLLGRSMDIDRQTLVGDLFCITAGLLYVGYILLVRNIRGRIGPWSLLFWSSLAGAPVMLAVAITMGEPVWPSVWWPLIGLMLACQIVGQGLLIWSLNRFSALIIGLVLLTQPAISVLAGWISFGEMLDPVDAIGMVLVAAALVVARARQA
jgi:drug/metabolite transporter (DMT)-like permease